MSIAATTHTCHWPTAKIFGDITDCRHPTSSVQSRLEEIVLNFNFVGCGDLTIFGFETKSIGNQVLFGFFLMFVCSMFWNSLLEHAFFAQLALHWHFWTSCEMLLHCSILYHSLAKVARLLDL